MKCDIVEELRKVLSPLPNGVTDKKLLEETQGTFLMLSVTLCLLRREALKGLGLVLIRIGHSVAELGDTLQNSA